ncbi:hypothetical protein NQ317_011867 [Molorchus minor]|uniref:Uncharacterized protein n=1 Tax=Molorchus minor TaxID=1323400 RepID=A0ABQ9IZH4_9CUCU|nr:hypothetical protein NQ317_011867 [Molorchus minor]
MKGPPVPAGPPIYFFKEGSSQVKRTGKLGRYIDTLATAGSSCALWSAHRIMTAKKNVIMCLLAYRVTYIDNLSIKRSPLELGYVTFPYETEGHKRFFNHNKAKVKVGVKDVTDLFCV